MFCSKCGKELEEGSQFCVFCGTRVSQNAELPENAESEGQAKAAGRVELTQGAALPHPGLAQEPIPGNKVGSPTGTGFGGASAKEIFRNAEQAIGKNTDYYLEQFEKLRQGEKGKINWAALFLGILHAGYRNVWQECLKAIWMPIAVEVAAGLAAAYFALSNPTVAVIAGAAAGIAGIWLLVVQIFYAKRFNRIYMQHVEKVLSGRELKPDISPKRIAITCVAAVAAAVAVNALITAAGAAGLKNAMSAWLSDIEDEDWLSDFDEDGWEAEEGSGLSGLEDGSFSISDSGDAGWDIGADGGVGTGSKAVPGHKDAPQSEEGTVSGVKDWPDEYDEYYCEGITYQKVVQSYDTACEYALYDMDKDGIEELLIGYGESEADYANAVWTLAGDGVMYVGDFYSSVLLYEAEDGNGIYAVYGHQDYQQVTRITKEGYDIYIEDIIEGEVGDDGYYWNESPIPWNEVSSAQ